MEGNYTICDSFPIKAQVYFNNEAPRSKTCRRAQVEPLQGILAKTNKLIVK